MAYSTIDIEKGLGISRERLREWTAKGFIVPSTPSPGQGRRAVFSRKDILDICLFDELVRVGFNRKAAGECIQSQGKHIWDISPLSPTKPNYLLIRFQGPSVHVSPVWADTRVVIDLGDHGKRKQVDRFSGKLMSSFDSRMVTDSLDGPFEHLHIINLKNIHSRVKAAFPG